MSYQLLLRNLLSTFTDEAAAFTDVLLCLTYILRNQVMYKSGLHSNYLIIHSVTARSPRIRVNP